MIREGGREMSAADHLGVYAEGWTKGDAEIILRAVTDDYTFDDPNAGTIPKSEFSDYLSGMRETVVYGTLGGCYSSSRGRAHCVVLVGRFWDRNQGQRFD
jgi:hypothetical protein